MSETFVLVYDKDKWVLDGDLRTQASNIVDWGYYSNVQGAANLSAELMSRWTWDTPTTEKYYSERGGGCYSSVFKILQYAKFDDAHWDKVPKVENGKWRKIPTWTPEKQKFKGLILLSNFQELKECKALGQPKRLLPIFSDPEYFGCRKNKQTKEHALEMVLRMHGPGRDRHLSETKRFLFGLPKSWKIEIYEREPNGMLKHETKDFMEEIEKFYGTSDLNEIKKQNTEEIYQERIND